MGKFNNVNLTILSGLASLILVCCAGPFVEVIGLEIQIEKEMLVQLCWIQRKDYSTVSSNFHMAANSCTVALENRYSFMFG